MKLLNETELFEKINKTLSPYVVNNYIVNNLVGLIEEQKRLYAESVIGEDKKQDLDPDEGYCVNCDFQATDGSNDCKCIYGNELRAEQRKRNK